MVHVDLSKTLVFWVKSAVCAPWWRQGGESVEVEAKFVESEFSVLGVHFDIVGIDGACL